MNWTEFTIKMLEIAAAHKKHASDMGQDEAWRAGYAASCAILTSLAISINAGFMAADDKDAA